MYNAHLNPQNQQPLLLVGQNNQNQQSLGIIDYIQVYDMPNFNPARAPQLIRKLVASYKQLLNLAPNDKKNQISKIVKDLFNELQSLALNFNNYGASVNQAHFKHNMMLLNNLKIQDEPGLFHCITSTCRSKTFNECVTDTSAKLQVIFDTITTKETIKSKLAGPILLCFVVMGTVIYDATKDNEFLSPEASSYIDIGSIVSGVIGMIGALMVILEKCKADQLTEYMQQSLSDTWNQLQ